MTCRPLLLILLAGVSLGTGATPPMNVGVIEEICAPKLRAEPDDQPRWFVYMACMETESRSALFYRNDLRPLHEFRRGVDGGPASWNCDQLRGRKDEAREWDSKIREALAQAEVVKRFRRDIIEKIKATLRHGGALGRKEIDKRVANVEKALARTPQPFNSYLHELRVLKNVVPERLRLCQHVEVQVVAHVIRYAEEIPVKRGERIRANSEPTYLRIADRQPNTHPGPTKISLEKDSELIIRRLDAKDMLRSSVDIELLRGTLEVVRDEWPQGGELTIVTPQAIFAFRKGTVRIRYDAEAATLEVEPTNAHKAQVSGTRKSLLLKPNQTVKFVNGELVATDKR